MENVILIERRWLAERTFEIELSRPAAFNFSPGQRVRLELDGIQRDYSLVSSPQDPHLKLCIREVAGGKLTPLLSKIPVGTVLDLSGPHGYFTFKPSSRLPVFVATGTGIAPFVSMASSGIKGFCLLHGVHTGCDLYYQTLLCTQARYYVPCITQRGGEPIENVFYGRTGEYLKAHWPHGIYDFYLSGRTEMIRDVTWVIDECFTGSLVYTEIFY